MKDSRIAKSNRRPTARGNPVRRQSLAVAAGVALVWAIGLLVGGCTSDPAGLVGAELIDNQIDSSLVEIDIVAIDAFSGIRVDNADIRLSEQEALYMGTETNTNASFIVNFDFADTLIFSELFPERIFHADSIKTVKLSLTKLLPYGATRDSFIIDPETGLVDPIPIKVPTNQPQDLYYHVFELTDSFDPLDYDNYPTPLPPRLPGIINEDFFEPITGTEPSLRLDVFDLLRWVESGSKIGIMVKLGPLSDPGLVGYASRNLSTFSEVDLLAVETNVGPDLIIDFNDEISTINLLIASSEDVTVFEEVAPAAETILEAADGFMLRTGLRSYPSFRFDLSVLPKNALINRAILSVTNDISTSFGPAPTTTSVFSIQVSEIVAEVMDDPARQLDVATLRDETRVYPLNFRADLRVDVNELIEFDITTGIRRAVNLVNEEPRGFLLSGVEDPRVFPFPNTPDDQIRPDMYYRQWNFYGLNDPDPARRPFLRVWYSVVNDLSGGGQ